MSITYRDLGYVYYPSWNSSLTCPHAGCLVNEWQWQKHEEWHQKLNQIIDAMNAGDI